jgi:hypothetical protein
MVTKKETQKKVRDTISWVNENIIGTEPSKEGIMAMLQNQFERAVLHSMAVTPYENPIDWISVKQWLSFPLEKKDIDDLNKTSRFIPPLTFLNGMTVFMVLNQETKGLLWHTASKNMRASDIAQLSGKSTALDYNAPDFEIPADIRNMSRSDIETTREANEQELYMQVRKVLNTPLSQENCAALLDDRNAKIMYKILDLADSADTDAMSSRLITKLLEYSLKSTLVVKDEKTGLSEKRDIFTPLIIALIGRDEDAKAIVSGWSVENPLLTDQIKSMLTHGSSSSAGLA